MTSRSIALNNHPHCHIITIATIIGGIQESCKQAARDLSTHLLDRHFQNWTGGKILQASSALMQIFNEKYKINKFRFL